MQAIFLLFLGLMYAKMQHFCEIERSYRTPLCLVSGEYPLWADRFQLPHKDGCGYFPKGVVFTAINPSKNLFRLPEKFWAKEKTLSGVYSALCLVVLELYGENHGVSRFWVDFVVYIGYNIYRLKFIKYNEKQYD
ncbi:MAG: hypothetical protein IJ780_05315 [Neisseriaceae bacterium]|nr:hypothetical protein [Neisseriaceae bacterium]